MLDGGVMLRSEANLVASKVAPWPPEAVAAGESLLQQLGIDGGLG